MTEPLNALEVLVGRERIREFLAGPEDSSISTEFDFRNLRMLSRKLGVDPIGPANDWQKSFLEHYPKTAEII